MHRTVSIKVDNHDNALYGYFDGMCHKSKCLYNAATFLIRQNMTGLKKAPEERHPLEEEAIARTIRGLELMNERKRGNYENAAAKIEADGAMTRQEKDEKLCIAALRAEPFRLPAADGWLLGYNRLEAVMKTTDDPDYRAMPSHAAQQAIKKACHAWDSWIEMIKAYKACPSKFPGRPRIPDYLHKDVYSAVLSNQSCQIKENSNGKKYLKLPGTSSKLWLGKGGFIDETWKFVQAEVQPYHGNFVVRLTFDDMEEERAAGKGDPYMAGLDAGVRNLAAIVDNAPSRSRKGIVKNPSYRGNAMVVKGGVIKAANRLCDKEVAKYTRLMDLKLMDKEKAQAHIDKAWEKRDARINDYMHKRAKEVVMALKAHRVGTLVVGRNKGWKQESDHKKKENQMFTQAPIYKFLQMLQYLCAMAGIRYMEREESYTSKASLLDMDSIPTYGQEEGKSVFSGKRHGHGRYRASDGTVINADLNAAGNILRKEIPDAFDGIGDFSWVRRVKVLNALS